ncbi:hypothetical protein CEXT_522371 [Caerostris extrusa]|uniref:DUF4175 domain-containing protein n=1 Tax=Caerostris extrusa TaxID=172846 RepID=A0AAV4Q477_CAEEX|nr:hypothetical protein CEXT_522371 [Caerostris extrusa]
MNDIIGNKSLHARDSLNLGTIQNPAQTSTDRSFKVQHLRILNLFNMKVIICLCVVLMSVSAMGFGGGNPFGAMMDQAQKAAGSVVQAMSGGGNPMEQMMQKAQEMIQQGSSAPQEFAQNMQKMFQQGMEQMSEEAKSKMQPFMEQMEALQSKAASPAEYKSLLEKMQKAGAR